MELRKLLKANIKYKKSSFISVIILMFIISLVMTTILSTNDDLRNRVEESFDQVGTGDEILFLQESHYSKETIENIRGYDGVSKVEAIPSLRAMVTIHKKDSTNPVFFMAYDPQNHPYEVYEENTTAFVKDPVTLEQGEVLVPYSYKNLYDCVEGDTLIFSYLDQKKEFTIKGFIEEPLMGSETMGAKEALFSKADFEALYKERITDTSQYSDSDILLLCTYLIHIYKDEDCSQSIGQILKDINKETKIVDESFLSLTKEQSISYTLMFINIFTGILGAFAVLLLIVVLIVMGHNISTSIEMDYVTLGILKSQGFSKYQLQKVYIMEYTIAQLIGMVLGVIVSIPCISFLVSVMTPVTGLLARSEVSIGSCLTILLAILCFCVLYVFIKSRKLGKISPVRAITGGEEEVFFASRMQCAIGKKRINLKLAFRQITSNKRQYISIVLITTVLVFFMTSVVSLYGCLDKETIMESFGSVDCDVYINYKDAGDKREEIEAKIEKISNINAAFTMFNQYCSMEGEKYNGLILSDTTQFNSILEGREPKYDNEVMITSVLSKEFGKTVGDTITITRLEKSMDYIISGIYQTTTDFGKAFGISLAAIRPLLAEDYSYENYCCYQIKDSEKSKEIVELLKEQHGKEIEVLDYNDGDDITGLLMSAISMITVLIFGISVIFVFVVVCLVCGKVFIKEKKEYGIYKAFGFTIKALRVQFSLRFFLVAVLGAVIGSLLNVLLNNQLMGIILSNVGITSFITKYSMISILTPPIVISLSFLLFSYWASRKIKTIDTKNLISE